MNLPGHCAIVRLWQMISQPDRARSRKPRRHHCSSSSPALPPVARPAWRSGCLKTSKSRQSTRTISRRLSSIPWGQGTGNGQGSSGKLVGRSCSGVSRGSWRLDSRSSRKGISTPAVSKGSGSCGTDMGHGFVVSTVLQLLTSCCPDTLLGLDQVLGMPGMWSTLPKWHVWTP